MPLYIIERNFAEKIDVNADCLCEAKNPEAIREAARRAKVPADVIVEVSQAFGTDPRSAVTA